MAKRIYEVRLGVTVAKTVLVRANSAKEARGVIYGRIPDEDELGAVAFSESVGQEFVIDVVREGESWHSDRKA